MTFLVDSTTFFKVYLLSASLVSLQGAILVIPIALLATIMLITHKTDHLAQLGSFFVMAMGKIGLSPFIEFMSRAYTGYSPIASQAWSLGKGFVTVNLEGFLILVDVLAWFFSCGAISLYPPHSRQTIPDNNVQPTLN